MLSGDLVRVTVPWCTLRTEPRGGSYGRDLHGGGLAIVLADNAYCYYVLVLYRGTVGWIHGRSVDVL